MCVYNGIGWLKKGDCLLATSGLKILLTHFGMKYIKAEYRENAIYDNECLQTSNLAVKLRASFLCIDF